VFSKGCRRHKGGQGKGLPRRTNTTFFDTDSPKTVQEVLDFLNDELEVDTMMISPGYAYEKARTRCTSLGVNQSTKLFREAFAGKRKNWRLNHSPLFLDFLEGKVELRVHPWGVPSYSVFGWQRPCYLLADGYTETYKELIETTTGPSTAGAATPAATIAWPIAGSSQRRPGHYGQFRQSAPPWRALVNAR